MKNCELETLDDLVFSWSFRNWALDKDCPEAGFWADWVTRQPERPELVNQAKAVIFALQLQGKSLTPEEVDLEIESALIAIKNNPVDMYFGLPDSRGKRRLAGATPFSGGHIRSIELIILFCSICGVGYLLFRTSLSHPVARPLKSDSISRIKMPPKSH